MTIRDAIAVVLSHIEAWVYRVNQLLRPRPSGRAVERRANPRRCVLCHGPMRSDRRPPRDVRGPGGQIRRLPEERLQWFKCARCERSQMGMEVAA